MCKGPEAGVSHPARTFIKTNNLKGGGGQSNQESSFSTVYGLIAAIRLPTVSFPLGHCYFFFCSFFFFAVSKSFHKIMNVNDNSVTNVAK